MRAELTDKKLNKYRCFKFKDGTYYDLLQIRKGSGYLCNVDISQETKTIFNFFNFKDGVEIYGTKKDKYDSVQIKTTRKKFNGKLCFKLPDGTFETRLFVTHNNYLVTTIELVAPNTIEILEIDPSVFVN